LFHQRSAFSYEKYERYGGGADLFVPLKKAVLCLLGAWVGSAVLGAGSRVIGVEGTVLGSVVLGSTKRARERLKMMVWKLFHDIASALKLPKPLLIRLGGGELQG